MSQEAKITCSLQITGGNAGSYNYQSLPQNFNADCTVAVANGHTPGMVMATLAGVTVDLSKLTNPGGWARLQNLDATNFVEFGVWDGTRFTPTLDLLPGEVQIVRLSKNIGNEYGAGTGVTATGDVYQVRVDPAQTTPGLTCAVLVEAHNK